MPTPRGRDYPPSKLLERHPRVPDYLSDKMFAGCVADPRFAATDTWGDGSRFALMAGSCRRVSHISARAIRHRVRVKSCPAGDQVRVDQGVELKTGVYACSPVKASRITCS